MVWLTHSRYVDESLVDDAKLLTMGDVPSGPRTGLN